VLYVHGAEFDLPFLFHHYGFEPPENVVDTLHLMQVGAYLSIGAARTFALISPLASSTKVFLWASRRFIKFLKLVARRMGSLPHLRTRYARTATWSSALAQAMA
jgi:hypothetical protein